jgi:hypothetical protein
MAVQAPVQPQVHAPREVQREAQHAMPPNPARREPDARARIPESRAQQNRMHMQ